MTPLQRRNLNIYSQFRGKKMTVLGLLRANARIYAILVFAFIAFGIYCYWFFGIVGASLVGVSGFTVMLRDIGYFRRSAKFWPVLDDLIDWQKADELLSVDSGQKA